MLGVLVNVGTVLIGSLVGLFLKRGIPEKVTEALMIGIGLCTVFIGISGALEGENTLVLILSMAIGTVIGTLLDIDKQLNRLAAYVEARFKQKEGQVTVAEGFVTASLGIGVLLADIFVLVFQGGIVLLAGLVAPFLTDYAIGEMTCAGSVLIIALGLNLIGVTKIKVANYLPVIFIPPILCLFMS